MAVARAKCAVEPECSACEWLASDAVLAQWRSLRGQRAAGSTLPLRATCAAERAALRRSEPVSATAALNRVPALGLARVTGAGPHARIRCARPRHLVLHAMRRLF